MQRFQQILKQEVLSLQQDWSTKLLPSGRFNIFLIACSQAMFCLGAIMLNNTIDPARKYLFYGLGLAAGLLIGIGSCVLLLRASLRVTKSPYSYLYESLLVFDGVYFVYAILIYITLGDHITFLHTMLLALALNAANWWLATRIIRFSHQPDITPEATAQHAATSLRTTALAIALIIGASLAPALAQTEMLAMRAMLVFAASIVMIILPSRLMRKAYQFLPWLGVGLVSMFLFEIYVSDTALLFLLASVGALALIRLARQRQTQYIANAAAFSWRDFLVIAAIFALTIDVRFANDRHHYDSYLGAINDMLHGKTLLVDSMSQYGWLIIYAVAAIFGSHLIPLSYSGFSLIISIMIAISISVTYLLIRVSVQSFRIALAATLILIVAHVWQAVVPMNVFPSTGPLRYLWLYVLIGLWAWGQYQPASKHWIGILKHIALILGIAWSLESALFCVALFAALAGFEISISGGDFRRQALTQAAMLFVEIVATFGAIYIITYLKSGQWPDWQSNIELLIYYPTRSPIYLGAVFFFNRWLLIISVYLVSLLLIAVKWLSHPNREEMGRYTPVFGMTVIGLLQFAYWIGNSTIITAQLVAAIFLIAFWYSEFLKGEFQPQIRQGVRFIIYLFGLYYLLAGLYLIVYPTTFTALHVIAQPLVASVTNQPAWNWSEEWNQPPTVFYVYPYLDEDRSTVAPAVKLINRYAADKDRIALLIPPDSTIETFMTVNKANVYLLDDAINDSLSPNSTMKALKPIDTLHPGDIVFIAQEFRLLLPLQQTIIQNLCQQFRLTPIEIQHGVAALKLGNLPSQPGDCECLSDRLACPAQ